MKKVRIYPCSIGLRYTLVAIVSGLIALIIFSGCGSEREYYDDLNISLEAQDEEIIIREWTYLLGSGAEIYYQKNNGDMVLLGKITGGDNGLCPFKEGLYELTQDGNAVTIKWCFKPSDNDKTNWKSKTFELPQ